jgi:hypothetical protein
VVLNVWPYMYMLCQVQIHILHIYVLQILSYTLSYVKNDNKNISILDIDDQNVTYLFASKEHSC